MKKFISLLLLLALVAPTLHAQPERTFAGNLTAANMPTWSSFETSPVQANLGKNILPQDVTFNPNHHIHVNNQFRLPGKRVMGPEAQTLLSLVALLGGGAGSYLLHKKIAQLKKQSGSTAKRRVLLRTIQVISALVALLGAGSLAHGSAAWHEWNQLKKENAVTVWTKKLTKSEIELPFTHASHFTATPASSGNTLPSVDIDMNQALGIETTLRDRLLALRKIDPDAQPHFQHFDLQTGLLARGNPGAANISTVLDKLDQALRKGQQLDGIHPGSDLAINIFARGLFDMENNDHDNPGLYRKFIKTWNQSIQPTANPLGDGSSTDTDGTPGAPTPDTPGGGNNHINNPSIPNDPSANMR